CSDEAKAEYGGVRPTPVLPAGQTPGGLRGWRRRHASRRFPRLRVRGWRRWVRADQFWAARKPSRITARDRRNMVFGPAQVSQTSDFRLEPSSAMSRAQSGSHWENNGDQGFHYREFPWYIPWTNRGLPGPMNPRQDDSPEFFGA